MTNTIFSGLVGEVPDTDVYEWTDVRVVIENNAIVDFTTQFRANNGSSTGSVLFPNFDDDVTIGAYHVQLTQGSYRHFPEYAVGANKLTLLAGSTFDQSYGGFKISSSLSNAGTMKVNADTTVTGSLQNNGLINVAGGYNENFLRLAPVNGTFTLSGAGDLRLVSSPGYQAVITGNGGESSITDFYNQGRISGSGVIGSEFGYATYSNANGGYLVLHNTAAGTIEANRSGQTLNVHTQLSQANAVDNQGMMVASGGGTLAFTGAFPHPDAQSHTGIWIVQSGAGTLSALAGSTVLLNNAIVSGGTLSSVGTGVIQSSGFETKLSDLDITATATVNIGGMTTFEGAIENRGTIIADGRADLYVGALGMTLTGGGSIRMLDGYYDPSITGKTAGAVLTNVDNTIHGVGFIGGANLELVNSGTISADSTAQGLVIDDLVSMRNSGILEAADGATLSLYNPNDGLIENLGGTIQAVGAGSVVSLLDTTIDGGKIVSSTGGKIAIGSVTFDGRTHTVTTDANIDMNRSALHLKGTIFNQGDVTLTYASNIIIAEQTTLSGGGTIALNEGFEPSALIAGTPGKTLTNVDNRISGTGAIGGQTGLTLINGIKGVITADQIGKTLVVDTGAVIQNSGILSANGGTLDVRSNITGTGHLEIRNGGMLMVTKDVDHDVTVVGTSAETLLLSGSTIVGDGFDFAISGVGVGDRIVLGTGYAASGTEGQFSFLNTASGAQLINPYTANFQTLVSPVTLKGTYSEGQFRLVAGADGRYGYERVATKDGNASGNTLTATATGERVIGLGGNDTLISGVGNDLLDGSLGTDAADYRDAASGVSVWLGSGTVQSVGGGQGSDRLIAIENLNGSAFDDQLTGSLSNNTLKGGTGNDTLFDGGGGTDSFMGGAGADIFVASGNSNASVTVSDFTRGTDKIATSGIAAIQSLADIAALVKTQSNVTNAVLTFDTGSATSKMTLTGVDWRTLTVSDFARIDNSAPNLFVNSSTTISENTAATTAIVTPTVYDAEGDRLFMSLSGADKAFFAVDENGVVRFKTAPNFEAKADSNHDNVYAVTLNVSDGALTTSQAISVTVADVDEAPRITSNGGGATASISVKEGVSTSTTVFTVQATDPDGDAVHYSLDGLDGFANLDIDSVTGKVTFQYSPDFDTPYDYDENNVYEFSVTASDGTNETSQNISLTVLDVNRTPVIMTNGGGATAAFSIEENHLYTIAVVGAADADSPQITYSLATSADSTKFVIDPRSGYLKFASPPDFEKPADANKDNVYDVIVRASDGFTSDTQTMKITVINASEAPVITSNAGGATATISVAENSKVVSKVIATDSDVGAKLIYAIVDGTDKAKFVINQDTGALSFITAPNFESPNDSNSDNSYVVKVQVSDGALTDTQMLTVNVINANEAPIITSNGGSFSGAISMAENTKAVTKVTAADVDAAAKLTYSIVDGADNAKFVINKDTGALSFIAAPNFEGLGNSNTDNSYVVKVQVSDGVLIDTQTLTVKIVNANEAPVITSNGGSFSGTISMAENTKVVTKVTATDVDAAAKLSYSIVDGADKAKFVINKDTGALSFIAAPNFESPADSNTDNSYVVKVQVSDGVLIDTQTLTVKVVNANEAPLITSNGGSFSATISMAENTKAVTKVTATDVDAAAKLTYSIVDGADKAKFVIDKITGALSFVAAPDFEKPGDGNTDNSYAVKVQVSDGVAIDTQTLTVKVLNVDGPPKTGGTGGDPLTGTNEAETLNGKGGNDIIKALVGSDILIGGLGADDLYGGVDDTRDTFVFAKGDTGNTASTWDQIFDFTSGIDKIDVSGIDAGSAPGAQDFRYVTTFVKATGTQPEGQMRVFADENNLQIQVDYDGNLSVDAVIQMMNVSSLAKVDFIF